MCAASAFCPSCRRGEIAIVLVLACGVVNWLGTRVGGASQSLGSAVKAVGLVILVAALFFPRKTVPIEAASLPPVFSWVAAAVALRAIYAALRRLACRRLFL